jgi:N-acetylglucosaminyldiphosphoundecaprenol N-acetyl-beta-D-mannosaminyltransferase
MAVNPSPLPAPEVAPVAPPALRLAPLPTLTGHGRIDVLGCRLDSVDMSEAVAACERAIKSRQYLQHMSVNVAKLVSLHDDPQLREAVKACGLVTGDGQGVVWASSLLGQPIPERVAGIDLMFRLLELSAERGYRPFILGAKSEVLELAVERLHDRFPKLELAGWRDGYFRDEDVGAVCREIRESKADILFVAMSSPRKEYFLGDHGIGLSVPFTMGVGGSIDVVAGITKRAPLWMQRHGLEWLFRTLQEPRRLARRYLVTNVRFGGMLGRELLRRKLFSRSRRRRGAAVS